MKLTVVGINYSPELTGIGPYTTDMCEYLAEQGHEVTMITGFPYYPSWELSAGDKKRLFADEELRGVKIKRCALYVQKNITSKQRIIHELSFLLSSFIRMLFSSRPDLYIIISPPLGLGISAYFVGLLKMRPFCFHIQDLQPDAAVSLGMLKEGSFTRFLFKAEKFIYSRATLVSTITQSMRDRIVEKGIAKDKTAILPNWSNFENGAFNVDGKSFRQKHDLGDKFIFLYSGNIGRKQGLDDLIEAASTITDKRILFLMVGTGAYVSQLKKKSQDLEVSNVKFLPLQPKEQLPEMLAAADVCLVIQKRIVGDLVFPSKMTNIMAAGRPALVTADRRSELGRTVIETDCGFITEPENPDALKECILQAFEDKELNQKGQNARSYARQHLFREAVLQRFDQLICMDNYHGK